MLSLVNYGSSDEEEDNITDEEEVNGNSSTQENRSKNENTDKDFILTKSTKIQLPQPKEVQTNVIEEDDDEFLHKKEVSEVPLPPPTKVKQKVKIMIPKLSDFKDNDEDDDDLKLPGPTAPNKKSGLLGMLPKPAHSIIQPTKPTVTSNLPPLSSSSTLIQKPTSSVTSTAHNATVTNQEVKKIGLIPYTLMEHKKTAENNKKKSAKRKGKDSEDESDDETSEPFFTFNSNEDLPQVNEDEIKAMVEREANRIELRKMQAENRYQIENQQQSDYVQYYEEQQTNDDLDQQAMKALVGGTKAKRSKLDGIQIVDLSDNDVLPNKEEWLRKSLAGETSFLPTGKIDEKGPALAKRKHQISYLAMRAEKNIAELEAMWAANRQNNREGKSKYGF
ncbi:hypothetical protein PVAND_013725 [Polypedilum vanderplanki]|uniref:Proline-rich protein PRCC n=1 Tax=Polypedilum vanderplanki TaxID=319348 RepID=A0A9J6CRK8_POLVA|nr:hypothetical protein PVAND_013725 [Polypedilum vanderplanki]